MTRDIIAAAAHQLVKLYSKCLPNPCFLCAAPAGSEILCAACEADLPLIGDCCQRCARPLTNKGICGICLQQPPPQLLTQSALAYQWPVDKLIAGYKFHQQLGLRDVFVKIMAQHLAGRARLPDLLVPVPLHSHRMRQRGFNQAADLANKLGKQLNIPVDMHCLQRIRATQPQSELPVNARRKNLRGAFQCRYPLQAQSVALIDDVYTTGHTAIAAGKCLLKNGVQQLEVWTVARTADHQ